jgi:hypothetical protein
VKYLCLGIIIGASLVTPRKPGCINELYVVDDPRGLYLSCREGAEMSIEGHMVRCTCHPYHTKLANVQDQPIQTH